MPEYSDHKAVLQLLKEAQEADHDNRQKAKEAHLFVDHKEGQWEPEWYEANNNKPRYTFDQTSPVIDQVAGEMEQADFDIKVKPAGGDATKETAQVFDGIIRNCENISDAKSVFNAAGRLMVTSGLDGWRVLQKYADANSFDQDLIIDKINNFIDRVWFDVGAEKQDMSDARHAWVLSSMPQYEFKERWKDRAGLSVDDSTVSSAYYNKADAVTVGEFYYVKDEPRELVLMSNGAVYEVNEEFEQIADELAEQGVTEQKRRNRPERCVYVRKFDGEGWLEKPKKTVFSYIPVIPTFGNFKVHENKIVYWGVVEKLIDAQRVLNYSMSREIEEGALAPRAKYWMSPKQAAGHEKSLQTMNTNADPVQLFNPDAELQGYPQQTGGAQINPGLRTISESMRQIIGQSAGLFAANMGDNPGLQSGVAIQNLQNKGDTGTIKYFKAQEVAIRHTARIMVDAIPKIYDTERQIRLLNEDGTLEMATVNQSVIDNETGQVVTINDLSKGIYDVTCSAGQSFKNRQQEMVTSFIDAAKVDPSLMELAGDIFLKNVQAPGMDDIAARKRKMLLQQGVIPEDQLTDEEKALLQQQSQQPKPPDANTLLAMAEMEKAKADQMQAQLKQQEIQLQAQIKQQEIQVQAAKVQQTGQKDAISADQKQQEFNLQLAKLQQDLQLQAQEQDRKLRETMTNMEKTAAETLKILQEMRNPQQA